MKTVSHFERGNPPDHPIQHIAASGHNKPYIFHFLQNQVGCFDKIFRSFLQGNPAQKSYDFVINASFQFLVVPCLQSVQQHYER